MPLKNLSTSGEESVPLITPDNTDPEAEPGEPAADSDGLYRMVTEDERREAGLCCPPVNRELLIAKSYYYCFFSAWGSLLPYLALYFKQLMLTPSQVGLLMGLKPFVNFLATPIWGALVDKFHIHRFALIISMIALITATFSMSLVAGPTKTDEIIRLKCNRTRRMQVPKPFMRDVMSNHTDNVDLALAEGEAEYYFSKSRWPWPIDFVIAFEGDVYDEFKIDATRTFTLLILIQLFGNIIASPSLALVDTATLQMLGSETHRYGRQRLTGSLGWGMGAFIVGASLRTTHVCDLQKHKEIVDFIPCFYAFAVLMTLGLVVSFKFDFARLMATKTTSKSASLSQGLYALRDPTYLMFLFTALYLGFLMSFIKTFLFWHLKDLGGTQMLFSVISAVNCVAEVSMYFLSEKLIAKIGQVRVLYLGLVCYSVRLFYYSVIKNTWMVLVVELLPGITTAAVWASCLSYVSINSRPGAKTTMQCILHGVHWGLGYGMGEVVGGILVHSFGAERTFVFFGFFCLFILGVYILINAFCKRPSFEDDTQDQTVEQATEEKEMKDARKEESQPKIDDSFLTPADSEKKHLQTASPVHGSEFSDFAAGANLPEGQEKRPVRSCIKCNASIKEEKQVEEGDKSDKCGDDAARMCKTCLDACAEAVVSGSDSLAEPGQKDQSNDITSGSKQQNIESNLDDRSRQSSENNLTDERNRTNELKKDVDLDDKKT